MPYIECTVGHVNAVSPSPLDFDSALADNHQVMPLTPYTRFSLVLFLGACASTTSETSPPVAATPARVLASRSLNEDMAAVAKRDGLTLRTFDLDKDKKPDLYKFYATDVDPKTSEHYAPRLARKDVDINHDGKIDVSEAYDANGRLLQARADLDFDGKVDCVTYYKDGKATRREFEFSARGKPDVIKFYDNDKLTRIEADRNGDGAVDTWEYYDDGKLNRIGFDSNLDGKADKWEQRQADGSAPASTSPAAAPKPAAPDSAPTDKKVTAPAKPKPAP